MKVLVDENLSPKLARALNTLFDEHEIVHLVEKFGFGVKDIDWIGALSSEGNWIVLSADRRIIKNRAEYEAFRNSTITGFFFSKGIYKSPLTKQMERLLALWPNIEKQVQIVAGGAMFELPMKSTRISQLR